MRMHTPGQILADLQVTLDGSGILFHVRAAGDASAGAFQTCVGKPAFPRGGRLNTIKIRAEYTRPPLLRESGYYRAPGRLHDCSMGEN
jgi:hypothetical protein